MPYTTPNFNLTCNVWHDPAVPPTGAPDLVVECQLYIRRGQALDMTPGEPQHWRMPVYARFPKLTDVRYNTDTNAVIDTLELPAGSGRHYHVYQVDDMHKGFVNEYRVALILAVGSWPIPIP